MLFAQLSKMKEFSRLVNRFPVWYRGSCWFFFHDKILALAPGLQVEEDI